MCNFFSFFFLFLCSICKFLLEGLFTLSEPACETAHSHLVSLNVNTT